MRLATGTFALATAALLLGGGAARADTVLLKDGRLIEGRVLERSGKIFIELPLGGTIVDREDVVRIERDDVAAPGAATDVVVLRDGRILHGDASLSADGTEVVVGLGERGLVRHPRGAVAVIHWRDGRQEAGLSPGEGTDGELRRTIDRRIADLGHADAAVRLAARRELLALGPFSRGYLEARADAQPELLRPVLRDLGRLDQLRRVLPAQAEESIPHLAERLLSADIREQEAALKTVCLEAPEQAGPLLLHVIRTSEAGDPDAGRIRAFCVSQLGTLRHFTELAEVLRLPDGPLRLAAAFALGDAGIYAGVPILIEALRLPDPEIRAMAVEKLRRYTGQHFGFRPRGSEEDRARAVEQWNRWWQENGAELVRRSIQEVAPSLAGSRVSDEQARRARELFQQASGALTSALGLDRETPAGREERLRRIERVVGLLREALDLDPGLPNARMTRAVLLYEELGRHDEAEKELDLIVTRAGHDGGDEASARKFAYYHQGQLAMRRENYARAAIRFSQAIQYDAAFLDALVGQGEAHLQLAFRGEGELDPQERRDALGSAADSFQLALQALDVRDKELLEIMRELVADSPESLEEGQLAQSLRRSGRDLGRQRAELHFKLGRVHAARQDDVEALNQYRMALRIEPENTTYAEAVKVWEGLVGERR